MTKAAISCGSSKGRGQVILEYILFALCLSVITIRAMITEGPGTQAAASGDYSDGNIYSLAISAVLICSFVAWFIVYFCSKRFSYRFSGLEIGLCLFIIAALIGVFVAANKRAAITHFTTLLAPILMAILLVQLLDSHIKLKLLLTIIVTLGMVHAYQSAEQYFVSNQMTIEQYEQNREAVLKSLGIEAGTFAHFLFEHRLYTKGVRGFFMTRNSAGSFTLLASFAAIGLFIDKLKNRKMDASGSLRLVICGIAVVIVLFGFVITRSRGAMVALFAASLMFIAYLLFRDRIKKYKKGIFVLFLLSFVAVCVVVIRYGLVNDRLPGGNSMLVRWQYWSGAAKMYADHPVTGVGGGNFGSFYTHYKNPSALETVADPHNFVLSILTQYGPLGLIGFLSVVSIPLWRASSNHSNIPSPKGKKHTPVYAKMTIPLLIVISTVLLFIWPALSPLPTAASPEERYAGIIVLHVIPVIVFIVGYLLLTTGRISSTSEYMNFSLAALFCGCLGVLIHNLIDFAIFEPSVFTAFCAVIASIVSSDYHRKSRQQNMVKPAFVSKVLVAVGGLAVILVFFNYALIPVTKAGANIKLAMQGIGYAHEYLDQAARDDKLDPTALNFNGRLYLQEYNETRKKQLLEKAAACFLNAIERNKANFKNYEKLSQVYNLLGDNQKAYDLGIEAVKRYPGIGRLQFNLAEIAESMGKISLAIEHYKEAVFIEDKYREQFHQMYPEWEVVSRLDKEKYERAKKQIQNLSQKFI